MAITTDVGLLALGRTRTDLEFSRAADVAVGLAQRLLIALTQKGCSREDAYKLVQRNAMPVWRGEGDFQALLKKDTDVKRYLSDAEISEQFDLGYHFKHVDTIFKRVFGES